MTAYEIAAEEAARSWTKKNILAPAGFTLAYMRYRLLRPVLKMNYKLFKAFRRVTPWTSQAAIRTFDRIIKKDMLGLEYGSGFSTIYFAGRLHQLVSVEHNPAWYKLVKEMLVTHSISNVSYHHIPKSSSGELVDFPFEKFGFRKNEFSTRPEYAAYYSLVSTFPDNYFDFIMVDGRARVECCLLAAPKLKSGGIFVLDNSDRARYKPVFQYLSSWKHVTSTTGLFDTTFWFKP